MPYSTIEIAAIILAILTMLKLATLYLFPKTLNKQVKHITKSKFHNKIYISLSFIVFLVLLYILALDTSIFKIFLGMLLGSIVMYMWMHPYKKSRALYEESIKNPHKAWLAFAIYFILSALIIISTII